VEFPARPRPSSPPARRPSRPLTMNICQRQHTLYWH
jgi:hypothetical protein